MKSYFNSAICMAVCMALLSACSLKIDSGATNETPDLPKVPVVNSYKDLKVKLSEDSLQELKKTGSITLQTEEQNANLQKLNKKLTDIEAELQKNNKEVKGLQQSLLNLKTKITETQDQIRANTGDLEKAKNSKTPLNNQHISIEILKNKIQILKNKIKDQSYAASLYETYLTPKQQTLAVQLKKAEQQLRSTTVKSNTNLADAEAQNKKINQLKTNDMKLNKSLSEHKTKQATLKKQLRDLEQSSNSLKNQKALVNISINNVNTEIASIQAEFNKQENLIRLAKNKLKIYKSLKSGNEVDTKQLVEATLLTHHLDNEINTSFDSLKQNLVDASVSVSGMALPFLKPNYEGYISKNFNEGESLIYNMQYNNVFDPLEENRIQCYSGTVLFNVINELSATPYRNTVVIFTSGHVLPGYIMTGDSGELILYGVETTASGKAIINYGDTSKIEGDIRVFDSRQFMLVELFKNEITNWEEVLAHLDKTIETYGFIPSQLKPITLTSNSSVENTIINSSPLGFGTADISSGDIQRESFDLEMNSQFVKISNTTQNPIVEEYDFAMEFCAMFIDQVPKEILSDEMFLRDVTCIDDNAEEMTLYNYLKKYVNLEAASGGNYTSIYSPPKTHEDGMYNPAVLITLEEGHLKQQIVFPDNDKKVIVQKLVRNTNNSFRVVGDVYDTMCTRMGTTDLGLMETNVDFSLFLDAKDNIYYFKVDATKIKKQLQSDLDNQELPESVRNHLIQTLNKIDSNNMLDIEMGVPASKDVIERINKLPENC